MDEQQRKAHIQKTFNTVAEGYGSEGMEFFHHAAALLPSVLRLQGHEQVLDVATGSGIAATALAAHLPQGQVTGIDFSEGMLAQARQRTHQHGLSNITLHTMDMTEMEFPKAAFDAANCSFGLFFVPDMPGLLRHIADKVKPGGTVAACSFTQGSFEPNLDLFLTRIRQYGVTTPPISWQKISTPDSIEALFLEAGLSKIETQQHDIGYPLADADLWWRLIWYAGFRGLVSQLSDPDLVRFKQEHLAEISALGDRKGIPLSIGVLFARGHLPQHQ